MQNLTSRVFYRVLTVFLLVLTISSTMPRSASAMCKLVFASTLSLSESSECARATLDDPLYLAMESIHNEVTRLAPNSTDRFGLYSSHRDLINFDDAYLAFREKTDAISAEIQKEHSYLVEIEAESGFSEEERNILSRDPLATVELLRSDLRRERSAFLDHLKRADPDNNRDVFIEIDANQSGQDGSLFVPQLIKLYEKTATANGWRIEVVSEEELFINREVGAGIKKTLLRISGNGAYPSLHGETGIHKRYGPSRFAHGSDKSKDFDYKVSVLVLPIVETQAFKFDPSRIKMSTYRSSKHGGQNGDKVSSAVRLTYSDEDGSNITVAIEKERDQHQNRTIAEAILRQRVAAAFAERQKRAELTRRVSATQNNLLGDPLAIRRTYDDKRNSVRDSFKPDAPSLSILLEQGLSPSIWAPTLPHYLLIAAQMVGARAP